MQLQVSNIQMDNIVVLSIRHEKNVSSYSHVEPKFRMHFFLTMAIVMTQLELRV